MKNNTKPIAIFAIVLSIMINCGCPGLLEYDIRGIWSIMAAFSVNDTKNWDISFTGDGTRGTVFLVAFDYRRSGTFVVDGKNIDIEVIGSGAIISFRGTITNNKYMTGNGTSFYQMGSLSFNDAFTWTARRISK